jgi:hypothetical protein
MPPFDFLFNESTKEWIWLPLWSAIVGVVLGWLFTRIVDGKSHSAKRHQPLRTFLQAVLRRNDVRMFLRLGLKYLSRKEILRRRVALRIRCSLS